MNDDDLLLTFRQYQEEAERTLPPIERGETPNSRLAVMTLGLTGEAGEVAELVKKYLGHGHYLHSDRLEWELGDVLWYIAALASSRGLSLERIARENLSKLRTRYPNGFSEEASKNRSEP